MGIGIQEGNLAKANAFNFDRITVMPMQMGKGGTVVGDVGPGIIYQKPEAHVGGSSMQQESNIDIGLM